jgi:uncharacterized repeat protein (TIGR01451 family)
LARLIPFLIAAIAALTWTHAQATVIDAGIDIRKQEEGPDERVFPSGSDVTFEIVVTNIGIVDLVDVIVSDPLVPSLDRFIGALAAGESFAYSDIAANVTASFTNIATVVGQYVGVPGSFEVMDEDPSTVTIERSVPEPTTFLLLGLGLAGLGFARKRLH